MEFKETPFGTEIIGLDKALNKVDEIGLLEAERDRLNAENDHLRKTLTGRPSKELYDALMMELEAHRIAIEKINETSISIELYDDVVQENERLREALEIATDYSCFMSELDIEKIKAALREVDGD